jgi:hypothetical protein
MRNRSGLYGILMLCAIAATRILFRSHLLYDLDSVNLALALRRFDPAVHQPHPPGYFLYICLGRLVNKVIPDPNSALVAISVAASCGAAWMIFLLTREWFGSRPAYFSFVLFLVSPLCWFHGIVALTYIVEAFFSALVGYLCWQVYTGKAAYAIPASIAFAVAAGFRPSAALFLLPLWFASIYRLPRMRRLAAVAAAAAAMLAWFYPMAQAAGGVKEYFAALSHLWLAVPARRTVLSSPFLPIARLLTIGWIFVLCFGTATPLVIVYADKTPALAKARTKFGWIWIGPGLLFFTFVFLPFVNAGYLLVLCPPVFAWMSAMVQRFIEANSGSWARRAVFAGGLAANCAIFALAPMYCSYRSVRQFEHDMADITRSFRQSFNPRNTLIIGFDSHFLGYRHAGYYLSGFVTAEYPEITYPDGARVSVMRDRDTQLARELRAADFESVVFFPLPNGPEYSAYLAKVLVGLPNSSMSTVTVGRKNFVVGSASLIPLLFPKVAAASESVYTPLHQQR